jgi:hypothetical protein
MSERHVLPWTKACTKCKEEKHNDAFSTVKNGLAASWCKACTAIAAKESRKKTIKHAGRKTTLHERNIEAYLVAQVKRIGGEVRKVSWIGRRGAPDRLVMLPHDGRYHGAWGPCYWIELKAPGKKPEPHQLREHQRMRAMGQRVEVIDSFEGVDALLGG